MHLNHLVSSSLLPDLKITSFLFEQTNYGIPNLQKEQYVKAFSWMIRIFLKQKKISNLINYLTCLWKDKGWIGTRWTNLCYIKFNKLPFTNLLMFSSSFCLATYLIYKFLHIFFISSLDIIPCMLQLKSSEEFETKQVVKQSIWS